VHPPRLDAATGHVELDYQLGASWRFTEVVELGAPVPEEGPVSVAVAACLRMLAVVSGISYYKVTAPPHVVVSQLGGPAEQALAEAVYGPGLAEFRYANGLDLRTHPTITTERPVVAAPVRLPDDGPFLVPVGGGKDSVTTIEMLRGHIAQRLFAVNHHAAIDACIAAAELPAHRVTRRLDPLLFELNEQGALNGHVPVTAIVSVLALATAVLSGCRAVVMSNERSASDPNVVVEGEAVNHQHSKSLDFERTMAAAVASSISPDLGYFSLLRPLSELAITRIFARMERYHGVFTSCNRAYAVLASNRSASWCCDCDKCRFVYLALAPFRDRDSMVAIFGRDLLDDSDQLHAFRALVGLEGYKPFECVGTLDETRLAVRLLALSDEWSGAAVVRALSDELDATAAGPHPGDVFAVSDEHLVPAELMPLVEAAAAGVPAPRLPASSSLEARRPHRLDEPAAPSDDQRVSRLGQRPGQPGRHGHPDDHEDAGTGEHGARPPQVVDDAGDEGDDARHELQGGAE